MQDVKRALTIYAMHFFSFFDYDSPFMKIVMNIAFIIHNQAETGPYWKVLEQCAAYAAAGHSVTIFCTSKTRRFRAETFMREGGVRVVEFPDALWGKLRQGVDLWNAFVRCRAARALHRERPFDIVHAVDCRPNVIIPALYMQRRLGTPLVLSWWDLFGKGSARFGRLFALTAGRLEGWLETAFRRYADAATTITSYLAERLAALGYPRERIEIHHLGVNTDQEPPSYDEARRRLEAKRGIAREENLLCFAGTIYESDFALLLQTLDILRAGNIAYTLLWIGKHEIPSAVCERYSIERVGVVPTMREVYEYFAAADVCILPMEVNEANAARWHSKTTDYLNAGAPVALTPVSDFPAYFARYPDIGWVARSGSAEDFAEVLQRALADKPRRAERGRAAREFMRVELDVKAVAARALALYERVIKEHSQRKAQTL